MRETLAGNPVVRGTARLALAGAVALAAALLGIALVAASAGFDEYAPIVLLCLVFVPLWIGAAALDPRWGVVAVFATFPIGSITTPLGGLQIVEIALIGMVAVVGLSRLGTGKAPLPWPPLMWWVGALIAWTFVALPSALDQILALKQIAALMGAVLLALIVVAACRTQRDVRIILIALVFVAVAIAAGALLQGGDFRSTFGGTRVAGRAVSSFDHSNQLGSLSAMSVLITVGLLAGARTARGRFIGVVALFVLIGGQALTLSRGAWIGTVVGLFFLAVILPHARRALIALALPLAAGALIIFLIAPESTQIQVIGQRFESLTVRSPYDDRTAIWNEAVREIVDDPVTGQGPGNFPVSSVTAGSGANSVFAYHAHNILLTWGAESGIPAALLIIGFAVSMAVAVARTTKQRGTSLSDTSDRAVMAGMAAALIALAAQGLVDFTLRNTVILYAVWTVIGCLLAGIRLASEKEESVEELPADRWWAAYG